MQNNTPDPLDGILDTDQLSAANEAIGQALDTFTGDDSGLAEGTEETGAGGGTETAEGLDTVRSAVEAASDLPLTLGERQSTNIEDRQAPTPAVPSTPEEARLQEIAHGLTVTPEMLTAFKAENPFFAQMDDATAGQALKEILAHAVIAAEEEAEASRSAGEVPEAEPLSLWGNIRSGLRSRAIDGPQNDLVGATLSGVAKAGFETYDAFNELVLGNEADPSEWRQGIERYYDSASGISGAAAVIAQFGAAFVGVGKFAKLARIPGLRTSATTRRGQIAQASAKGAAADFLAFDGLEGRLADIVQQYPALENPITEFLATKPDDTQAEGRLKNALEGFGIGATADVVLAGIRAVRAHRKGDAAGVEKAVDDAAESYDALAKAPDAAAEARPRRAAPDEPSPAATQRADDESLEPQPRADEEAAKGIIPTLPREELEEAARRMAQRVIDDPLPPAITPEIGQPIPSTFDSLTRADDLRAIIDATEREILQSIDGSASARGRISIEETQRLAQELAADTGQDPGSFFLRMQRDSDNIESLSARILAYDQTTRVLATEIRDLAHAVRAGSPGQYGTMEALKDAFEGRLAAYSQVQDWLKGVRSETGRALAIMRHSEALGQGIDVSGAAAFGQGRGQLGRNASVEELAEAVIAADTNRKMLGDVANPTKYAEVRDAFVSLFIKNILSGPTTHLVNLIGNVSAALSHPAAKILGGALHRDPQIMREGALQYGFMVSETYHALKMAGEAYKRGHNILDPMRSKFTPDGRFPEALTASKISGGVVPDDSVTGYLANGVFKAIDAVSTRALSASDEFFKQSLYASELTARAWADGLAQGLQGDALKAYMREQRAAGFTTAPDVGANTAKLSGNANAEAAFEVARFNTFTQNVKPDSMAGGLLRVTNRHPELKFAVPFVRVVSNLLEFTGTLTPGIANVMQSYKGAIARGGRDAAVARGRLALGYAVWSTAMHMAASGQLTGAGPVKSDGSPDYKKRQLLEQTGWKPYALKVGDTYINLARLDPWGLPFNIAATAYEKFQAGMREEKAWIDIASGMSFALGHVLLDRQYLKGLADFMEALKDETGHTASRYVANLGSSILVPNIVRQTATANADPIMREARGLVESIMRRTPFASENLAARRMPWGAKMEARGPIEALVSSEKQDPLMREYARLLETGHSGGGEPLPRMKPVQGGKSIDLAATRLSNGELLYDVYGDLIEQPDPSVTPLTKVLRDMIESDTYKNELIDGPGSLRGTRLKAWQTIISRYRAAAWRKVLELHPEVRERVYGPRREAAAATVAARSAAQREAVSEWLEE